MLACAAVGSAMVRVDDMMAVVVNAIIDVDICPIFHLCTIILSFPSQILKFLNTNQRLTFKSLLFLRKRVKKRFYH